MMAEALGTIRTGAGMMKLDNWEVRSDQGDWAEQKEHEGSERVRQARKLYGRAASHGSPPCPT